MSGDDDYEIPESGAVFTFGRSRFAENLSSHFFVRNDPVIEVSCGDDHTALVCKSGRVFLFGRNDYGQLGFGHNKLVSKPSCLKYLKPFHSTHIACGKGHTIVSTACNRIFTFGCNSDGQLGIGDLIDRTVPQMVHVDFSPEDNITALAAGCHHSALLTEGGNIFLWGSNSDGQCGTERDPYFATPRRLEFEHPINTISCGYYHTAFTSSGCVYTFGEEDNGKLGRSRKSSNCDPEKVEIKEHCNLVKCGGSHTMVLTEDGTVYAFGSNFSGQLGIQPPEAECFTPKRVEFPDGNVKIIYLSCGESHSAFVTEKGSLYTCGDSRYGKLGNEDDSINIMTPILIHLLDNYYCTFVSCGGCHTMVLAKADTTNNDTVLTQKNKDALPPIKTNKDLVVNVNPANATETSSAEDVKEEEKNCEDLDEYDSKSNTESNLINEEVSAQLDDIYTEIEDIVIEKNEAESKVELKTKPSNDSIELIDDDLVVKKENAIKKLLKVFKRKKSASAILLSTEPELKDEETQMEDSLKTEHVNLQQILLTNTPLMTTKFSQHLQKYFSCIPPSNKYKGTTAFKKIFYVFFSCYTVPYIIFLLFKANPAFKEVC